MKNNFFKDKSWDLVLINMSSFQEWQNGISNRNYHIFRELQKRPEIKNILLVDFLPFTFKRALRNYWENIFLGIKGKHIMRGVFDRCVQYEGIYIYSTIESLWSEERVIRRIREVLYRLEFQNILLWSYQPMFVKYFSQLGEKVAIFDAVDNWCKNEDYATYQKRLKENYSLIAKKATIIFTVAKDIVDFFHELGRKDALHWIPNGVNIDDFKNQKTSKKLQKTFSRLKKPIIGYIGTIQNRVDFFLIQEIAKQHSDWSIVLAGPTWPIYFKRLRKKPEEIKMLEQYSNVHFLGRVPYQYMPFVVSNFSVGIIPHKINTFVKSMNPMKMYDYLAAGIPLVSTAGAGLELFQEHILVGCNAKEFIANIEKALQEDSLEKQKYRKQSVEKHTYAARVDEMMCYVRS